MQKSLFPMDFYLPDQDLEFLQFCNDEDLHDLVRTVAYDDDCKPRRTSGIAKLDQFQYGAQNLAQHWKLIAAELQTYGGDTLVNTMRGGKGVRYREILGDVARAVSANRDPSWTAMKQEEEIIQKLVERAFANMDESEKLKFATLLSSGLDAIDDIATKKELFAKCGGKLGMQLTPTLALLVAQTGLRMGGFLSYQLLSIALNAISQAILKRGLTVAANAFASRSLAIFLGPVGWIITAGTTVPLITGPAYRVTIPTIVKIALLRRKLANQDVL